MSADDDNRHPTSDEGWEPSAGAAPPEDFDWFAWYDRQRAHGALIWSSRSQCWEAFAYDAVKTVLTRHEDFSSDFRAYWQHTHASAPARSLFAESLIRMDPPQHTAMRQLVNPAFHGATLEARVRPRIAALVQDYLDRLPPEGDFVRDFAYPLPVTVIAELLGVPAEDRDRFKEWVDALLPAARDPETTLAERRRWIEDPARQAVWSAMADYFEGFLRDRRQHPQDDLMTLLLTGEVGGRPLTAVEILEFCALLLIAGHVTTTNLLANSVWWLAHHPEQRQWLAEDGDRQRWFLEEVLRFLSPVQRITRYTARPCRLGAVELPAHALVVAWIGSANRDPARFPDADRFVPNRQPNPHLAFGSGVHTCLGAPLARLEGRLALAGLIRRFRAWECDDADRPRHRGILFGPERLRTRWQPA